MSNAMNEREGELLRFLALAVHDLKSPLAVISGSTWLLRNKERNEAIPEETQEYLDRIMRNTLSVEHIVADLSDAIAARSGHLKLNLEEVDLTALACDVVQDYGAVVKSHPLRFEGDRPALILGDRERMKRTLWNLLSNAFKYSAAGREVTVSVWQRGAHVYLTVLDRGVGIPTADGERLFLPYKRLDCTCYQAEGSGLGLVSVQEIVEAHGADISVQGAPGPGMTFEICFKARMKDGGG
ncbi:MAG: HAMP domain-containing histidine kinase [Armatimonadota bacterium]|nr:HAMP domain-containing histidine kinase [Armatimonadota bacterium]